MKPFVLIIISIIAAGCAQIVAPTGGDKDEVAPVLISASPKLESTRFEGNQFSLEFDEYVQLNDVANELIISPPLSKNPVLSIKKKTILLEFDEPLMEETTYTFNFGQAIRDVNEGNSANVTYVLSTGTYIDSLQVEGVLLDAFTNLPVEGAKVMLYQEFGDSLPLLSKPSFFGRSNAEGIWKIDYLKAGNYKIFALKEELGNYLYDQPTELIAFISDSVSPYFADSLSLGMPITLRMGNEGKQAQLINSSKSDSTGHLILSLQNPVEQLNLIFLGKEFEPTDVLQQKLEGDSLHLWLPGEALEKTIEVILFDDSLLLDTLEVDFFLEKDPSSLKLNCPPRNFRSEKGVKLSSNQRITEIDTSKIRMRIDSLSFSANYRVLEDNVRSFEVLGSFEDGRNYELTLLPGAIKSGSRILKDTLSCNCSAYRTDFYGKLELNLEIEDAQGQYIMQFLTKSASVAYEFLIAGSTKIDIPRMEPSSYSLRLIDDTDVDGLWTGLNYFENRQAEKVYYFNEELQIRSNWEQKLTWKIELRE